MINSLILISEQLCTSGSPDIENAEKIYNKENATITFQCHEENVLEGTNDTYVNYDCPCETWTEIVPNCTGKPSCKCQFM